MKIGVTTAPVVGSGVWPAWMARVATPKVVFCRVSCVFVLIGVSPCVVVCNWVGLSGWAQAMASASAASRIEGRLVAATTSAKPLSIIQSSLKIFSR